MSGRVWQYQQIMVFFAQLGANSMARCPLSLEGNGPNNRAIFLSLCQISAR